MADPEANLGGGFSRPEGPSESGYGRVSPSVGGGSGGLPRENFEKMKQTVQSGVQIKPFKLTQLSCIFCKNAPKCTLSVMDREAKSTAGWDGVVD